MTLVRGEDGRYLMTRTSLRLQRGLVCMSPAIESLEVMVDCWVFGGDGGMLEEGGDCC